LGFELLIFGGVMIETAYAMGTQGGGGQGGGIAVFLPLIFWLILWPIFGWSVARIAKVVGRDFALYFVLGLIPLVNLIALFSLGNQSTKRCPQCAEVIRKEAKKCRYCGHELDMGSSGVRAPLT
jgi:hypothetical protein